MIKRVFFATSVCILLMICFSSCPRPASRLPPPTPPPLHDQKNFNTVQFDASGNETPIEITANLIKSTDQLGIYLRENQSMADADVNYIADNFEAHYANLIDTYGTHTDVDGNEKIIILLYDINKNIASSGGYIAGFFWGGDLLDVEGSNKAEILYVESQVSNDIKNIFDTVVHEFQHLINFNMNYMAGLGESDLWLNEALSESSEIVVSEGRISGNRMDGYNSYYHDLIADGNYFYHWNKGNSVLADYSTASLFMYWLYLNGGETAVLKNIARASVDVRGDYNAVLEAVGKTSGSLASLNSWEEILLAWLEANENYTTGYPNGEYATSWGRTGSIRLTSKIVNTSGTYPLRSGDAVLSTNETTGGDTNIVRSFFDPTILTGDKIYITLNKDTDINASATSIQVPVASVRNFTRMSDFPALVDEGYRIIHIPQRPLTGEAYE